MRIDRIVEGDGHRTSADVSEVLGWYDELPAKDRDIMRAIVGHLVKYGRPPTRREIAESTGISSTSVVSAHLKGLKETGYVLIATEKTRAIGLVDRGFMDIEI